MDVVTKISNAMHVDLKPTPHIVIRAAGKIQEGSAEWAKVDKDLAAAQKHFDAELAKTAKAAASANKPAAKETKGTKLSA